MLIISTIKDLIQKNSELLPLLSRDEVQVLAVMNFAKEAATINRLYFNFYLPFLMNKASIDVMLRESKAKKLGDKHEEQKAQEGLKKVQESQLKFESETINYKKVICTREACKPANLRPLHINTFRTIVKQLEEYGLLLKRDAPLGRGEYLYFINPKYKIQICKITFT